MDADVIVVGGGLAGGATALALASGGLEVLLLDAAPPPAAGSGEARFDGRAYSQAAGARRFWESLGVWERIAEHAEPMLDIVVSDGRVSTGAAPLFLHFDHRETDGGPLAHVVEDRRLRAGLEAALADAPTLERRAPVRVTGSAAGEAFTEVTLESGETLRARLLVACDGRRSPIAGRAGIRRMGWDYDQTGLVCAVAHERPHLGVAHELFLPSGPFAILPLPDGRSSLVWTERGETARAVAAMDDAAYLAEVEARFGDFLGALTLDGGRWAYPLSLSLAYAYAAPRLALTGDAAHAVHPIAGQGLNLGLRDAAALAEVVMDAARRGEDIGAPGVLARYQSWRRFDATALALSMDALNRLFSNDIAPVRALRDFGLGLVNRLPGAKRAFMGVASGATGETPRLMRGEPL